MFEAPQQLIQSKPYGATRVFKGLDFTQSSVILQGKFEDEHERVVGDDRRHTNAKG